jgi:hypothetical protein
MYSGVPNLAAPEILRGTVLRQIIADKRVAATEMKRDAGLQRVFA